MTSTWRTTMVVLAVGSTCAPTPTAAQFSEPCELACIAVLGATSFVTATGVAVTAGRLTGGLTRVEQGLFLWGLPFAAMAGGGMALSGNGSRQRRAIYAAGIGTLAGALAGGLLGTSRGGDEAHVISATLLGATAGAVIGGAVGALTWTENVGGGAMPLFSIRLAI